jgi:ubiquinone/menaquinone biosynthesis C-methylase UbiE
MSEERKARIQRQFGRAAGMYAVSEHRTGKDLDLMIEFAGLQGHERVLDVATGAGHTALAFARHVEHVVVSDLVEEMVDQAREQFAAAHVANAEFRVADVEDLPFGDATYDVVTCRIAPHHFTDVNLALKEITRVLVPGGRFVVVDSTEPELPEAVDFLHRVEVTRDPTHVRSYSARDWHVFLEAAGLVVDQIARHRMRRAFEFWLDRGGVEGEVREELRRLFKEASPAIREELEIEYGESGEVVAFSDDKVVIGARKPS